MKKYIFLIIFILTSCGGSSEETVVQESTTTVQDTTTTTVQDTTTTTIPPAPTSDINYIELFNSKLGTELCSDATEIDTTSEECLRQYKENLNYLIALQNEIGDFASVLIAYYETYPELVNQEYEDYINFVENDYSRVFTTASTVEDKYVERFGGVPEFLIFEQINDFYNECPAEFNAKVTENFSNATLTYLNRSGEKLTFTIKEGGLFKTNLNTQGGNFKFLSGNISNFIGEKYEISNLPLTHFYVNHWDPIVEGVNILEFNDESVTIEFLWDDGKIPLEGIDLMFERKGLNSTRFEVVIATNYGKNKPNYDPYWFNWGQYLEVTEGRIVYKHPFKSHNGIDLDDNPFYLYWILDMKADGSPVGTFQYMLSEENKYYQRKVGCNGEQSIEKINNNIINPFKNLKIQFND